MPTNEDRKYAAYYRETWEEARDRRKAEVERLSKELEEMKELLAIAEAALADPLVKSILASKKET